MKRVERIGKCVSCGGCCKKFRITAVLSNIVQQHGSIAEGREYYKHHRAEFAEIDKRADRVLIEIDIPCSQLTSDNKCKLHLNGEKKPAICGRYPWYQDDIETCGFSFIELPY